MLTPAKHLKAVDTSQPAHFIKGGVVVDPRMEVWLGPSHKQGLSAPPLLMQVDLTKETLTKLISRSAVAYAVESAFPRESDSFCLSSDFGFLSEANVFITALSQLHSGFLLKFSLSPARLVAQLWAETAERPAASPLAAAYVAGGGLQTDAAAAAATAQLDDRLTKLTPYIGQRVVLQALEETGLTDEILAIAERELEKSTTELLMGVICGLLSAGLQWERLPGRVWETVEGMMKSPSSHIDPVSSLTLVHSIRMLTLALEGEDPSSRARAADLVALPALCPLVSRQPTAGAERLARALMGLFRAVYTASEGDEEKRRELVEYFKQTGFKAVLMAASFHVERESPAAPTTSATSLLHPPAQSTLKACLLDLLQIRLSEYAAAAAEEGAGSDVIRKMMEMKEVEDDDDLRAEWVATLRETPRSALTARFLLYMHKHNADLLENWRKERKLRLVCGARPSTCWQLLPLAMELTAVIARVLAMEGQENREWLWFALPLLLEEPHQTTSGALVGHPVERLFVISLQRAHALWGEMETARGEEQQVASVLEEMLWTAARPRVMTIEKLSEGLRSLSYEKLREEWSEQMRRRADTEDRGGVIGDLRRKLEPLALSYVTTNKINCIKMGSQFRKIVKGKQVKDSAGELWKLESNGNFLTIKDIDAPKGEETRRIDIKEITGTAIDRPKGNALPRLRMSISTGPDLVVCSDEEIVLKSWMDGLNALNESTHKLLSPETKALVQRLLTMEVRIRLMSLPSSIREDEMETMPVRPLPPLLKSFKWCTDAMKKVHVS